MHAYSGITIFVKTETGKTITLELDETDTIKHAKCKIESTEGIPPYQQKLMVGTMELDDDKYMLSDYKIKDKSTLMLYTGQFYTCKCQIWTAGKKL